MSMEIVDFPMNTMLIFHSYVELPGWLLYMFFFLEDEYHFTWPALESLVSISWDVSEVELALVLSKLPAAQRAVCPLPKTAFLQGM